MAVKDILLHIMTAAGKWKEQVVNLASNDNSDTRVVVVDSDGVPSDLAAGNDGEFLAHDATFKELPQGWNRDWYFLNHTPTGPLQDDDLWDLQNSRFNAAYDNDNLTVSIGSRFECFGMINTIGGTDTVDWTISKNRYVLLTAGGDGWFNIKNNAGTVPSNSKNIVTGINTNLYHLKKALCVYDPTGSGSWAVISYEKIEWAQRYDIPPATFPLTSYDIILPIKGLPMVGYYKMTVHVAVMESILLPPGQARTLGQQTLTLTDNSGGDTIFNLDASAVGAGSGGSIVDFFNADLQGSCIVKITGLDVLARMFKITVGLPNGEENHILNGYVHTQFLGNELGKDYLD